MEQSRKKRPLKTATPSIINAVRNGYLTWEGHDEILQFQKGLLAREIQILEPTAVVFFNWSHLRLYFI